MKKFFKESGNTYEIHVGPETGHYTFEKDERKHCPDGIWS